MNPFKIAGLLSRIVKGQGLDGKFLSLKAGTIVEARVLNVSKSSGVALRIGDAVITASSKIDLEPGASAYFKVLPGAPQDSPQDVKLQFIGYVDRPTSELKQFSAGQLIDQAARLATDAEQWQKNSADLMRHLLKALPADIKAIVADERAQLMHILKSGIKLSGRSMPENIGYVLHHLETKGRGNPATSKSLNDLLVHIHQLSPANLKQAVENSGVIHEAKLHSALRARTAGHGKQHAQTASTLQKDVKAALSELRTLLQNDNFARLAGRMSHDHAEVSSSPHSPPAGKEVLAAVEAMLRDIEAFQLLSKLTDSFYTYLPIAWDALKYGELAFRKAARPGVEDAFYCLVNLDLEHFGGVTITVLMQQKEFFVSFKTGNSRLQALIANHLDDLRQLFEESDIKLKSVNVLKSKDRCLTPLEQLDDLDTIINIKV